MILLQPVIRCNAWHLIRTESTQWRGEITQINRKKIIQVFGDFSENYCLILFFMFRNIEGQKDKDSFWKIQKLISTKINYNRQKYPATHIYSIKFSCWSASFVVPLMRPSRPHFLPFLPLYCIYFFRRGIPETLLYVRPEKNPLKCNSRSSILSITLTLFSLSLYLSLLPNIPRCTFNIFSLRMYKIHSLINH